MKTIHNELLVPMDQPDVLPLDHGDFEFFSDVFGMVPLQGRSLSCWQQKRKTNDDDGGFRWSRLVDGDRNNHCCRNPWWSGAMMVAELWLQQPLQNMSENTVQVHGLALKLNDIIADFSKLDPELIEKKLNAMTILQNVDLPSSIYQTKRNGCH
ncbi:hypothetical protein L1987_13153 [Smallanthus sonchifolius]|uniref:Uncharacterized protein n=1 Tax=Smallanthus sonchifolius TaxID=185202 RepID=A0ACB9JHX7_9ASTR|nr:hypothetical protein L1987_13153 [Smallanthus sonchifolius]